MLNEEISAASQTSGACGKFGDKLFTVTVVRARQKNAGIAGPTSNFSNAAMAGVTKKSVIELSARPTSEHASLQAGSKTQAAINYRLFPCAGMFSKISYRKVYFRQFVRIPECR